MANIFFEIEDEILLNENVIFDEIAIKEFISDFISNKLNEKNEAERAFYFEEIIYNFFEYLNIQLIRTKKTRDFGIDGFIKLKIDFLGDINIGLQIKYQLINSNDIDLFLSALRNAELQLGVIVCKDSRKLEKYELNSKIKAIFLSKGIKIREKLIKEEININPVFVLKFEDILDIIASEIRAVARAIYKK